MSKFGELIDVKIPVLFHFYTEKEKASATMSSVLRGVAKALGDKAKIITINTDKNSQLVEALRIKDTPTFVVYKNGEMKWRQSGTIDSGVLIAKVKEYEER